MQLLKIKSFRVIPPIIIKVLLVQWLLFLTFAAASPLCDLELSSLQQSDAKQVKIDKVIDGDTVRLLDKRLVRFVGINTPEIDHETGNSEPYANEARKYLRKLVHANRGTLLLRFDHETEDRHGRLLAHVFTPEGKNIQAQLLSEGLAVWITVPPNLDYMECYQQHEHVARRSKTGIWNAQFRTPRSTATLTIKDRGFQWISGRVTRIGQGRKNIWINFENHVAARIHKKDLQYFQEKSFTALKGRTIILKGWMFPYKNQLVMSLRHPASLEIME